MRRFLGAIALVASAALCLAAPAAAQYGASVRDRIGQVTPDGARAGETVTFVSNGVFTPGSAVDVVLVRALQGATGTLVGDDETTSSTGAVSHAFQIASGTSHGIYIVYATGTSAGGEPLRVVAILVVLPASAQATTAGPTGSGDGGTTAGPLTPSSSAQPVVPPAEVQSIQQAPAVEASLLDEVLRTGSSVVLDGETLVAAPGRGAAPGSAPPVASVATTNLPMAPLSAALVAIAFATGGLLVLRNRRTRLR